jgi:ADP-dependent NAD(P)H-hydrate dehydratase
MKSERTVTADLLRGMPLPQPEGEGGKEERGRVLVVGGSVEVPGGALLAGTAVLRAGAGKLQIATCRSVATHLAVAIPEARVVGLPETSEGGIDPEAAEALVERAGKCSAVLIGPGMMDEAAAAELTGRLLAGLDGLPIVLDAAAMMNLRNQRDVLARHDGRVVVTPHPGEMAALTGMDYDEVVADPLGTARRTAELLQAVVALKGSCTRIVTPDGESWSCSHGNVGLATSGSGDTLAGVITGLLARGTDPVKATLWGVYLHAEAGNRLASRQGKLGFLAREILAEVPAILSELGE